MTERRETGRSKPRRSAKQNAPTKRQAADTPADWSEGERIAKFLARAGVCSRRDAEKLIENGQVAVNGDVLATPAFKVTGQEAITLNGEPVRPPQAARLWRYHKPAGLVTTNRDPDGRPTVFDALPSNLPRVVTVGRLDLNTEGLLLLTNDGELARALELPDTGIKRKYRARAYGRITQAELDKLRDGVVYEGMEYRSIIATLERATGANSWINMTLTEGKKREARRALESLGLTVNRLIRVSYGPLELGDLPTGGVVEVPSADLLAEFHAQIAPAMRPDPGKSTSGHGRDPAKPVGRAGKSSKVKSQRRKFAPPRGKGGGKPKQKR